MQQLRIVHLSTSDIEGGAAIAALRLCQAQREAGHEAQMLVLRKRSHHEQVVALSAPSWQASFARWGEAIKALPLVNFQRGPKLFSLSLASCGFSIVNHPLLSAADIIHMHWINQGFLSLRSLKELASLNKPIVWTLHDMWPLVGICHYAADCKQFEEACSNCPQTSHWLPLDLCHRQWRQKQQIMQQLAPTLVGCSRWMLRAAKASAITKDLSGYCIANAADLDNYRPLEPSAARKAWSLPSHRPILLYGAQRADDPRKGYDLLIRTMQLLRKHEAYAGLAPLLVIFGKTDEARLAKELHGIDYRSLGYLSSPRRLSTLYSAADLFLTTSREDNLPNTLIEAQLCDCPSLGFAVGGIGEIISHEPLGCTVAPFDCAALTQAIVDWLDRHPPLSREQLHRTAIARYAPSTIAEQYISLYRSLLASTSHA